MSHNLSIDPPMVMSAEARRCLSQGIQYHLASVIEAANTNCRKRTNRTACDHYEKTQRLFEEDRSDAPRGSIKPENRRNLGMMWGPDRRLEIDTEIEKEKAEYKRKYLLAMHGMKAELTAQDEEGAKRPYDEAACI